MWRLLKWTAGGWLVAQALINALLVAAVVFLWIRLAEFGRWLG